MTEPNLHALPDSFDLDSWIDGTCKVTLTAKVYQRGDLITEIDRIQQELETVRKIPKDQRSAADKTPETLADEWERLATIVAKTAMTFYVEDRTEERRRKIRNRLVKDNNLDPANQDDQETIILHWMADAVTKVEVDGVTTEFPDGFPVNKLREIKNRVGDSGLMNLRDAYFQVINEAPTVAAPLSQGSSSNRGGIT
jgi:hypothetical protein